MMSNISKINKSRLACIIYTFAIVIFTMPKSIDNIELLHTVVNCLKIFFAFAICLLMILNKLRCNKFSLMFLIYFAYVILISFINHRSMAIPIKTYVLDAVAVLSIYLLLKNNSKDKAISFLSNYYLILLTIAFGQIIILFINSYISGIPMGNVNTILGLDNRMFLYSIIDILFLSYNIKENKISKVKFIYVFLLSLLSTLLCYSVMGFISIVIILLCYFINTKNSKFKINTNVILLLFIGISIFLVFANFNDGFFGTMLSFMNKLTSLKYRKYIWKAAVNSLVKSPVNIFIGFGFFDTHNFLAGIYPWATAAMTPNHLHNLLLNTIFFSGIIGLTLYIYNLYSVSKNLNKIKKYNIKRLYIGIYVAFLAQLLMDTFEYYQVYYMIFILLGMYSEVEFSNQEKGVEQNGKKN